MIRQKVAATPGARVAATFFVAWCCIRCYLCYTKDMNTETTTKITAQKIRNMAGRAYADMLDEQGAIYIPMDMSGAAALLASHGLVGDEIALGMAQLAYWDQKRVQSERSRCQ